MVNTFKPMIPRTRVNYSLPQLMRSFALPDGVRHYRDRLLREIASYFHLDRVLLMPSGRAGLYYLLRAMDRPKVIIPAYTCRAVAEAARLANKVVVFVDAESRGFNLSVDLLADVVDESSVVIATHQFGIPCEISRIVELCRSRGALCIEDAAASLGGRVQGRPLGTFGDASFFSFDSSKLVQVPIKGGFILVQEDGVFERARQLAASELGGLTLSKKIKTYARALTYLGIESPAIYRLFHHAYFVMLDRYTTDSSQLQLELSDFYAFQMTEGQAYLARLQWQALDDLIRSRRYQYRYYQDRLAGARTFQLPPVDANQEWACVRFPICVKKKLEFYARACQRGVDFAFSFSFLAAPATFRRAHEIASSILDLPFYYWLKEKELETIVATLMDLDREMAADFPVCLR